MRTHSQIKHKALKLRTAWLLPAFALLIACSGIPLKEREAAERDRYEAYAGNPIDHFTYLGRFFESWEPIGRDELVIWTGVNDAYLIKVAPPCEDLQFANRIGLTSTGGTVYSRFDSVKVRGWKCAIQEIRPIDYKRLRQDLRNELREAKAAKEKEREKENKGM